MAPPATISRCFELLRAFRAGDRERLAALATRRGRKVVDALLGNARGELAQAAASWRGTVLARYEGDRAVCRFTDLDHGRLAVLELRAASGDWLLEDVRIIEASEYATFGEVDDRTMGLVMPSGPAPVGFGPAGAPPLPQMRCARCGAVLFLGTPSSPSVFCVGCGTINRPG